MEQDALYTELYKPKGSRESKNRWGIFCVDLNTIVAFMLPLWSRLYPWIGSLVGKNLFFRWQFIHTENVYVQMVRNLDAYFWGVDDDVD